MDNAAPRISINTDVATSKEMPPFLARITIDQMEKGKFANKPWQWHIGAKPFKFNVKGLGFQEFVGLNEKEVRGQFENETKFTVHLDAFKEVFATEGESFDIGQGHLLDRIAWFRKGEHVFGEGKDRDGNSTTFKASVLIPVRLPTEEEYEEIGEAPPAPKEVTLTPEQADLVLNALAGSKRSGFQKAAFKAKLPGDLVSLVVNGAAIDYLTENGLAEFDEDDILQRI